MNDEFRKEVLKLMKQKGFNRHTFKNGVCQTISFFIPETAFANLVIFGDGSFEFKYAPIGYAMKVVATNKNTTIKFINTL